MFYAKSNMALPIRNVVQRIYRRHRSLFQSKSLILYRRCSALNNSSVRVRFAPSPTGQMHLGGLRTALYNYLFAKSEKGVFILRIEDTDQNRAIPGAAENILSVLRWSGLNPDEGPGIGGEYGPYNQSERQDLYTEYADRMLQSGHAYKCFCTTKRLGLLRKEQLRQGETTGYDNKCRNLTQEEVQENLDQKKPYVIRFKEWCISTPKHIQMYKAFGWTPPQYGHLPLILNQNGTKLSKRQDDIQVSSFMERHTDPNALLNYLTTSNSGFTESTKGKTLQQMVESFSLSLVTKNPTRLQPEQLRVLSLNHLIRQFADNKTKTVEAACSIVQEKFGTTNIDPRVLEREYVEKMLSWALDKRRIFELSELADDMLNFIWSPPSFNTKLDLDSSISLAVLTHVIKIIENDVNCDPTVIKDLLVVCCKDNGWSMKDFFKVIRKCLSSEEQGPPVAEMIEILGQEESLRRFRRALEAVSDAKGSSDSTQSVG